MASLLDYPHHEDLEWFAVDRDGFVARFTTGGCGPVPRLVLPRADVQGTLRGVLAKHARVGGAELIVRYSDSSDFVECAERGVFAYDWSDVHRTDAAAIGAYELIARPTASVALAHLKEGFEEAGVALPRFEFFFRECLHVPMVDYIDWLRP